MKINNGGFNMAADNDYILYSNEKYVKGVLRVADHEFAIRFWNFQKNKMADPIWRLKNKYFILYPDERIK